jgi:hypothetical protein
MSKGGLHFILGGKIPEFAKTSLLKAKNRKQKTIIKK